MIISHIDDQLYAEQILKRGANLSIDRIGTAVFFSDDHWLEMIADPDNNIQETDETNNATRVLVTLAGNGVSGV